MKNSIIQRSHRVNEKEVISHSVYKPEVQFIITHQSGRLGNQLVMFAHFIASAIENNQKVVNLAFYKYANLFESTSKDVLCRYPPKQSLVGNSYLRKALYKAINFVVRVRVIKRLKFLNFKLITAFNRRQEVRIDAPDVLGSTLKRQIIFAKGYYFCDYINLLKHADEIKKFFVPLASHRANISNLIDKAKETCDCLVGIHIRRGDYKYYQGGKHYYEIDTYIKVMNRMEKLLPNKRVGFLVCSDDALDKSKFCRLNVFFGTNHIVEDMYSLAYCDYIIGPVSTYSRWASFYRNVPLYWIDDPDKDISLDDFRSHEEIVRKHMLYAPQFPHFTDT